MAEFDAMLQSLTIMLAEEELWECFESFDLNSTGDIVPIYFYIYLDTFRIFLSNQIV